MKSKGGNNRHFIGQDIELMPVVTVAEHG